MGRAEKQLIRNQLYELELDTDEIISSTIHSEAEF